MSQIIYTNDEMAYDENNQQITHMQPASPMTQETTTIHYVPSRNVSNWEMTSASYPERWDDNGHAFYYNTSFDKNRLQTFIGWYYKVQT